MCEEYKSHNSCKARSKFSPEEKYFWGIKHYFCKCAGCDSFSYAIARWEEGDYDHCSGDFEYSWKTYPYAKGQRLPFEESHELPPKIRIIYKEVIGAINAQLPVLSAIGLRALIETLCKERGVKGKNLADLIDGLATNGVLSTAQASILHSHRFLGNIAAHEIESAKQKELIAALEIAESLLRTIYVLPNLSKLILTGKK